MKKISLLFAILGIVLIGCSNSNSSADGDYTVSGTLKNAAGKTIYLERLTPQALVKMDSAVLDESGKFNLHLAYTEPDFFILQVDERNFVYLTIDSTDTHIEVTGDANDLVHSYAVKGSHLSQETQAIVLHNSFSLERIDSLSAIYKVNQNSPKIDSIKHVLDLKYRKIYEEERRFLQQFINRNSDNLAGLLGLYQQLGPRNYVFSFQQDMPLFEKVAKGLAKNYPNCSHTKQLNSQITQVKAQIAEQQKQEKISIGQEAPDIAYPNPEGKVEKLSDLRGKYVLLDFWASWCAPCRGENPNLVANYKKYHDKGFEIFQVSLDQSKDSWIKAIKADQLNWHHVSDLKYWSSAPAKLYGVRGIPANFLLDKDGKIIAKNLRGPALGMKLKELFGN
jgi:peroxiredoxin